MSLAPPQVYGLHGLRIRTPLRLAAFPSAGNDHDLDVRLGPSQPVPACLPGGRILLVRRGAGVGGGGAAWLYAAAIDADDHVTLRVPGMCDFVFDRRRSSVDCRPDPSSSPEHVALLVAGLVVAFVLDLAGHCVIHASAVEVGGRAIAFAGASGSGKSTLAALLCAAGARLVTDDVLRLATSRDAVCPGVWCIGGAPQLRLRPGAAWALDHFEVPPVTGPTADQRLAVTPTPTNDASVLLSVILLPHVSRSATAIEVRPVTGAEAVVQLAGLCRVLGWQAADLVRQQFELLAQVTAGVPIVEAVLPWGPSGSTSMVPALLDLADRYDRRPTGR